MADWKIVDTWNAGRTVRWFIDVYAGRLACYQMNIATPGRYKLERAT